MPTVQVNANAEDPSGTGVGYVAKRSKTGSKTDSAIITNPQSISTITRDQMDDQGVQTVDQALRYTSAVYTEDSTDTRFDQIHARGFDVDSYLDGLALFQSPRFATPRIDPYLLDRIDVLLGPSSVLYGQGNPGGLVNFVSKQPTDTPYHEIMLQAGNHDSYELGFDFSGPLDPNGTVLYRVTGLGRDASTQVSDIKDERIAIAPSVTIRPDRDTQLTVQAGYQRDPEGGLFNVITSSGTLYANPNGRLGPDQYFGDPNTDGMQRTQYWIGYQFDHSFNDVWSVSQNVRYLHIDQNYYQTSVTSPLAADNATAYMWGNVDDETQSQFEVDTHAQAKFSTADIQHTVLFGIDYRHVVGGDNMANAIVGTLNLFDPDYASLATLTPNTRLDYALTQVGLYGQDELRYRNWVLTLGMREDWSRTEQTQDTTYEHANDSAFTWRAGLAYEFSNGIVPYVSYAKSFEPVLGATEDGTPFRPTTGEQYEIGLRYQPKGYAAYFRLAAYDLRQKNVETTDPNNPDFEVQTGQVRSRGIEAEAHANITEALKVIASYAYLDQRVTEDTSLEGTRPTIAPRHNAAFWGDYTMQGGPLRNLGFGTGVRYMSDTEGSSTDTFQVPARVLVDAAVHYDLQKWRLGVNVNNLFNREYISYCTNSFFCYWGATRSIVGTARYQW
ncbi:TonB-dependent siderophore receptor [Pararobbsia silviterrae]|uniref:TonB-dependent siderophore receptor n=1 Tax=Pararobbsia silviterrae TaxID=1792498 RepID=A0A494XWK9_9BURK|nr:TonB-dependent siderophore receptor [Pararobbsia silviterrae]